MKKLVGLACTLFLATGIANGQTSMVISSYTSNGKITWSNEQEAGEYTVEWASSPTGTWSETWTNLAQMHAQDSAFQEADVPMFYRLKATPATRLLLHCDGANGSTAFPDTKGNTTTAFGPLVSTNQSKFGGASAFLNGTFDYIEVTNGANFAPGSRPFAVDFWIFPVTNGTCPHFLFNLTDCTAPATGFRMDLRMGSVNFAWLTSEGLINAITTADVVSTGNWHHVALTATTNTVNLFVDGINRGSSARITNALSAIDVYVGKAACMGLCGGTASWAYMDEIRYTVGRARWTNNFVVPSAPYDD